MPRTSSKTTEERMLELVMELRKVESKIHRLRLDNEQEDADAVVAMAESNVIEGRQHMLRALAAEITYGA